MQPLPQLPIDRLIMHLIDMIIHWVEIIPTWIGRGFSYSPLFTEDLRQLDAIHSQLRMHLCTRPIHPWANEAWKANLIALLSQTLRQSKYCSDKLISLSPYLPPASLDNLAGIYRDLIPYLAYAADLVKSFPSDPTGISTSKSNL